MERGTVRVKYFAQENKSVAPARARTQTTKPGVEHADHQTTAHQLKVLSWDWMQTPGSS